MRTNVLLLLAALATGCVTEGPDTSEDTSDLTFYSPRLAITARIARERKTADDLRGTISANKPPAYSPWTAFNDYRNLTQSAFTSADAFDVTADDLEAALATAQDLAGLDAQSADQEQKSRAALAKFVDATQTASSLQQQLHDALVKIIAQL